MEEINPVTYEALVVVSYPSFDHIVKDVRRKLSEAGHPVDDKQLATFNLLLADRLTEAQASDLRELLKGLATVVLTRTPTKAKRR